MHISLVLLISPYSAQIMLQNALFCRQNARLKNRLFCSKLCRQNLSSLLLARVFPRWALQVSKEVNVSRGVADPL